MLSNVRLTRLKKHKFLVTSNDCENEMIISFDEVTSTAVVTFCHCLEKRQSMQVEVCCSHTAIQFNYKNFMKWFTSIPVIMFSSFPDVF